MHMNMLTSWMDELNNRYPMRFIRLTGNDSGKTVAKAVVFICKANGYDSLINCWDEAADIVWICTNKFDRKVLSLNQTNENTFLSIN
jgi:hypothetical protein